MIRRHLRLVLAASTVLIAAAPAFGSQVRAAAPSTSGCASGARTLAPVGSHLYPDTGNSGYTSVHTDIHMTYDAVNDMFLPGNHVDLVDRSTQCLSDFSLDFERHSANPVAGPDLTVNSITVNGRRATYRFVQPTYPSDPHGQNDPNPAAHEASEFNPVGGPDHNPLPPACSPELSSTNPAHKTRRTARNVRRTSS